MFVYGAFADENDAADAVRELMRNGFDVRYISALLRAEGELSEVPMSVESGVERGAVIGAALGAAGGALLATGSGLLAAGPLLAALGGAVGGGAFGSLQGGFFGLLAKTKIEFGEEDLDAGRILLGVNADQRHELAREVLANHKATRIRAREEPLEAGPL